MNETILAFDPKRHRDQVADLWRRVFAYPTAHNEPNFAVDKKVAANDGLFFVAEMNGKVIGTIMAGYDGHRGWIYSLAVLPDCRGRGIGTRLMRHAEDRLAAMGCPKINVQILETNKAVEAFYTRLGYKVEPRISMGKTIPQNIPTR